jgi:hypothetical protein
VFCPGRGPVTTLDCIVLRDSNAARLGPRRDVMVMMMVLLLLLASLWLPWLLTLPLTLLLLNLPVFLWLPLLPWLPYLPATYNDYFCLHVHFGYRFSLFVIVTGKRRKFFVLWTFPNLSITELRIKDYVLRKFRPYKDI